MKTVLIIHHSKPASLLIKIFSLTFYKTESSYCQGKEPMVHYLRNLIETMIGNKCNSGILVTDKKPSLINSLLSLQIINKYKKIKFIIIE